MQTIADLLASLPQQGRLTWIGRSAARGSVIEPLSAAMLRVGTGLDGDHHAQTGGGKRQVTLLQAEHLPVIAAFLHRDQLGPADVRRNLLVSGLNLLALKDRRFRVGAVLLEGTGQCHPCSRMEQALGPGGYNAVRGHGGITAVVVEPGIVRIGDVVALEPAG